MKIEKYNGEKLKRVYQWDSEVFVNTEGILSDGYMHFAFENSIRDIVSMPIENGKAQIPNQLLQKSGKLFIYLFTSEDGAAGEQTHHVASLEVVARPKPPEYIDDPTPVITYPELVELVTAMQKWQNISASADTLEAGMPATALAEIGEDGVSFLFGIPRGKDGKPGKDGDPGTPGADGNGIVSIEKTSSSGLVDTYTITFTNGTSTTFSVTNGDDGNPGLDGAEGLSMYINDTSTSTATTITNMPRSLIYVPDGRTLKVGDLILLTKNSNLYRVTGFPTDTTVSADKVGTYEVPNNSITTAKLANGSVTDAKLAYPHNVLLWTNSNQSAGMENNTIVYFDNSINLTVYHWITIEFAMTATSTEFYMFDIPAETFSSGRRYNAVIDYGAFSSTGTVRGRQITGLWNTSIRFGDGYQSGVANSARMVPTRIWARR